VKETPFLENQQSVLDTLKQVSFFSALEDRHLREVFRMSRLRQYEQDEVIIAEGVYDSFIYVLLAGEVKVMKSNSIIARMHRTGDIFGELAIINYEPRSATVKSVARTSCLAVDAAFLDNLLPGDRDVVYAVVYKLFAEVVASRLRTTSEELASLKEELAQAKKELTFYRR
jgi:CRP/FNR family cyclic AMP-dependent transcriptional regulator